MNQEICLGIIWGIFWNKIQRQKMEKTFLILKSFLSERVESVKYYILLEIFSSLYFQFQVGKMLI